MKKNKKINGCEILAKKHICDNCSWNGDTPDEIDHPHRWVDPSNVVPSGQCPKCGALCYPVQSCNLTDVIKDAVVLLKAYQGLTDSLLDLDKNPDRAYLKGLQKNNRSLVKKLQA